MSMVLASADPGVAVCRTAVSTGPGIAPFVS